jgi:hypothetical protein
MLPTLVVLVAFSLATPGFAQNAQATDAVETPKKLTKRAVVASEPLPASEKLALVFSKSTDNKGKSRQVLVFLGRVNDRGWEAIGNGNPQELREHWRKAALRSFEEVRNLNLTVDEHKKLDLAIEFTIARFIRIYEGLQADLESIQRVQADVLIDHRYNQLRKIATTGLFDNQSLAVRVANEIASNKQSQADAEPN